MKKQVLSRFTLKMLILFTITALYVNLVYLPLNKTISTIENERSLAMDVINNFEFQKSNMTALENRISELNAKNEGLERIKGYANPKKIMDAVRTMLATSGVDAKSIVAGEPQVQTIKSSDGKSMLYIVPISVSLIADAAGSARFISALENHPSGAYSVDNLKFSKSEQNFTVQFKLTYFDSKDNQG